ncbi:ferritin-like-domain-containing protein [Cytidiella melzeri]|nr:ferritin-like-domain-containing protein [Cytidiella melzeri]
MPLQKPAFPPPQEPPSWRNGDLDHLLDELKQHLQTAIILEMYTIPLYLFAAYSIKDSPKSTYLFLSVVKQEMLHMGLAGNILCSIGGTPKTYGPNYTPKYPREIFFEPIEMKLLRATRDHVQSFVNLEKPMSPQVQLMSLDEPLLTEYHSIGQFYQEIDAGLRILNERFNKAGRQLFQPHTFTKQFQTADGSWYDPDMAVITDIDVATSALHIIITQGEGATGEDISSGIWSHYQVFKTLHDQHELDCYNIVENPVTSEFEGLKIHPVMVLSDATYSYLLMTIEILWQYDGNLRGRLVTNNIMNIMLNAIKPVALFLVARPALEGSSNPTNEQQAKFGEKHAAPAFNRHDFGANPFQELKDIAQKALAAYPEDRRLQEVAKYVRELIDLSQLH